MISVGRPVKRKGNTDHTPQGEGRTDHTPQGHYSSEGERTDDHTYGRGWKDHTPYGMYIYTCAVDRGWSMVVSLISTSPTLLLFHCVICTSHTKCNMQFSTWNGGGLINGYHAKGLKIQYT